MPGSHQRVNSQKLEQQFLVTENSLELTRSPRAADIKTELHNVVYVCNSKLKLL
jgi:hypothetical protein